MDRETLAQNAEEYLTNLCHRIPTRRVGAEGNRMSTDYFARLVGQFGFKVETPVFDCVDWVDHGAHLLAPDGEVFEVFSSPYTLGCQVEAPLSIVRSVEELEDTEVKESVLLLIGEIAVEQVMPKNFPFYNPEHHQHIVRLLEEKDPLAIITATGHNPELAGGMYPFPMIEDGDFDIPSVYMKDVDGEELAAFAGQWVSLTIESERIPATGHNVVARKLGGKGPRVVLCAHIDAKDNTPGALDNGTGVVMLMLLAELLSDYYGSIQIELLAFNGEDHYSAQGHKEYLRTERENFDQILMAINTDVAGYVEGYTAYSLYGTSEEVSAIVEDVMGRFDSLQQGEQWYQSDHSVFIQNGRPAMAITSEHFMRLSSEVTHTPKDDLDLVDFDKLADMALALNEIIAGLDRLY